MATAVEVASLFSTLGLKMNDAEWKRGNDAIGRADSALKSLAKLAAGALAGLSFGAAIKSGIAFNANMEQTRDQIAGMLALAKHTDLNDQLETSDGLMKSLQERAKKLPGSLQDYTKVLGMIAQPITDAGIGIKDLEDITVGAAVAAKAFNIDLEAAARDVNQAIMGQFHSVDQLTGRILGSLGYVGEAGRKRFNSLSKAQRAAVLKDALTQKQLAQLADAQSKSASGRWDTFKANIQETLGRVAAPLFAKLSTLLAGANAWLEKNSATIAKVAGVIGDVLGGALNAVVSAFGFLTSGSDEAIAALVGIGVAIGTVVVPALGAMLAGWIAAAAPILAVVAAVAAIAYGVVKLIKHWDKVRAIGGRAWDWIKSKAQGFVDFVTGIPGRIASKFEETWESIKTFFRKAFDWIVAEIEKLPSRISAAARKIPVLGWVGQKLGEGAGFVANKLGFGGDQASSTYENAVGAGFEGSEADWNQHVMEVQTAAGPPAYEPTTSAGTWTAPNVTTNITINPTQGMSEERVGELAGAAAREHVRDVLRTEH